MSFSHRVLIKFQISVAERISAGKKLGRKSDNIGWKSNRSIGKESDRNRTGIGQKFEKNRNLKRLESGTNIWNMRRKKIFLGISHQIFIRFVRESDRIWVRVGYKSDENPTNFVNLTLNLNLNSNLSLNRMKIWRESDENLENNFSFWRKSDANRMKIR